MTNIMILSPEMVDRMIKEKLLKPAGTNEYLFCPFGNDNCISVFHAISHVPAVAKKISRVSNDLEHITREKLQQEYDELLALFPASDKIDGFPKSRTLRTKPSYVRDPLMNYTELRTKYGLTYEQIKNALDYEIFSRTKESHEQGKNVLTYMKSFGSWINDVTNIKTQLELREDDAAYHSGEHSSINDLSSMFDIE